MTVNVLGPGHYENTGETTSRPSPTVTGINGRSWFAQCDVNGEGGTNIDDQFLNALLAELRMLVDSSGGAQSESSEEMISEAVGRYASGAIFATDSGAANAYVLATTLNFHLPTSYFHGMRVIWRPANAPTGASTANVNSIGAKAVLRPDGTALVGTEFSALALLDMIYDSGAAGGAGGFRLTPWSVLADQQLPAVAPFFPEITTGSGVFTFTPSTGQIIIDAAQTWLHRSLRQYSTDSFSAPNRTFATSANKTYHLRWYPPGHANAPIGTWPNGRFMLRDLADTAVYNTGSAVETSSIFDTTFDDMLVARVVTNGSNALTVTALKNKARLAYIATHTSTSPTDPGSPEYTFEFPFNASQNWSRTPTERSFSGHVYAATGGAPHYVQGGPRLEINTLTRYGYDALLLTDWAEQQGLPGGFDCKGYVSLGA